MLRQSLFASNTPIATGGTRILRPVYSAPPATGLSSAVSSGGGVLAVGGVGVGVGVGVGNSNSSPSSTASLQDVDMVSLTSFGTDVTMKTALLDIRGYGPVHPTSVLGQFFTKASDGDPVATHQFLRLMNGRSYVAAENLKPHIDAETRDDVSSEEAQVNPISGAALFRMRAAGMRRQAMEAKESDKGGDRGAGIDKVGSGRIVSNAGTSPVLRTPLVTAGCARGNGERRDGIPADIMTTQRSIGSPGGLSLHSGSFDDIPGLSTGGKKWLEFLGGAAALYFGLDRLPSGPAHIIAAIVISYYLFMYQGAVY